MKKGTDNNSLGIEPASSQVNEDLGEKPTAVHDSVFGEIREDGPNYRSVGWLGTAALMMKTQIGLGVLSIPSILHTMGVIPGIILLCIVASITTWSGYVVGQFKLRHRHVYAIDDAGELMFGRIGREVIGAAFCLFFAFCSGGAMLGISIALNAVSTHGTYTAVFVAVAAIIGFVLGSIQTLGRLSWLACVGVISIMVSVITVTIAVGVQNRTTHLPRADEWTSDYKLFNSPNFVAAITSVSSLVFSYAGPPAFFALASEMREPKHYTRSLFLCQGLVTATYIAVGTVVYYYCGSHVASPALGSAGPLIKKVAYGLALPGLSASTFLCIHLPAKYIFVRILRGSDHLSSNTPTHWVVWFGCTSAITVIAYLVASGIPVFGTLISLIGALLGTTMVMQPMGCMWLYDNWKAEGERTLRWGLMVVWSLFIVISEPSSPWQAATDLSSTSSTRTRLMEDHVRGHVLIIQIRSN